MTDPLFNPDSLKKNHNWFAEPFTVKDPALLELRKQCETSFPKNRAAGLAFVAMKRVQAEVTPNYKTVYAWGYSYYLATYRGFQRYGRNPVSNPMHTYWTESNTEYLRLRFLIEADNGTMLIAHVRQSDLINLGRRLLKAYPDDMMVHGELINAFKRDYRDDKDKEFVTLIRSLAKKYPESFEKAKYQLMGYAWLWQATRKPLYADISIAILRQMLSVYSDRIVDHAHYERTIAEIEKKRDRPKEPILWPPVPR